MLQPRNTLVVLKLHDKAADKIGNILLPDDAHCYTEAEVMAVGPGTISAAGGRPETADLRVGDRVLVKHKEERPGPAGSRVRLSTGQRYVDGGVEYYIFEQTSVLGIIGREAKGPFGLHLDGDEPPSKSIEQIFHHPV